MGVAFNFREEGAVKTAKHGYDRKPSKEEIFARYTSIKVKMGPREAWIASNSSSRTSKKRGYGNLRFDGTISLST
jgi:hypothetical protein